MFFFAKDKNSKKYIIKKFLFILFFLFIFFVLCLVFIALAKLIHKGFSLKVFYEALNFANKIAADPLYLFSVYEQYFKVFIKSAQHDNLTLATWLPMFPIFLFGVFLIFVVYKWGKKFYRKIKKFEFSSIEKLFEENIFSNNFFVLGQNKNDLLELKQHNSLLVLGETSSSKTSSCVIPSILEADNSSLFVVASQNDVAKFTSGYRAQLGKVFYFNWGLSDDASKKEFLARWNPLSQMEMPKNNLEKEEYLYGLCKYFITYGLNDKSDDFVNYEKSVIMTMFALLNFFVMKIERAQANDYFLSRFFENKKLHADDKDLLLSYYILMDKTYAKNAIDNLQKNNLSLENYLPIGSWEGVPDNWKGKELCFAMFYDWLLRCFFKFKKQNQPQSDLWQILAEYCLEETEFFGYSDKQKKLLKNVLSVSAEQKSVIFSDILKSLECFQIQSVRERTSTSDFCIADLYNSNQVITVYSIVEEKIFYFINKLFVDMVLNYNLVQQTPSNMAFVFDDIEQQPRYEVLGDFFKQNQFANTSFLMTVSFYDLFKQKYLHSEIVSFLKNISYKLLFVQNYKNAAKLLQNAFIDSDIINNNDEKTKEYYKSLIWDMNNKIVHDLSRKDVLLLVPKLSETPFCLKAAYFLQNEYLKSKAEMQTAYFLDENQFNLRNSQDLDVPDLLVTLNKLGYHLENMDALDDFLKNQQNDDVLSFDDAPTNTSKQETEADWWLEEDFFEHKKTENQNPFKTSN